jgi:hypothetical protein
MAMQTDVKAAYLNQTGFILGSNRSRLKGISAQGTATAGQLDIFATSVAPTAATYGQAGTVITVTSVGHGLSTGTRIGIAYSPGTGGTAMCGNTTITVTGDDTFTIACINSFTITAGAACRYVVEPNGWLSTLTLAAGDTFNNYYLLPGQGILANNKVYCSMSNIRAVTIFHG